MLKAFAFPIKETTREESTPPDRNAPRGTSLTSCRFTHSPIFRSTVSSHSASVFFPNSGICGTSQYVRHLTEKESKSIWIIVAGSSFLTDLSNVLVPGTYSHARNSPRASTSRDFSTRPLASRDFISEPHTKYL